MAEDTVSDERYEVKPIGRVESPLVDRADAPTQGDEGAPDAWLIIDERFRDALCGPAAGADLKANWLPVPEAPFDCWRRTYWPKAAILDRPCLPPMMQPQS